MVTSAPLMEAPRGPVTVHEILPVEDSCARADGGIATRRAMAPASEIKCRMAERAQPAWRSIRLGLPSLQRIRNLGGTKSPITARRSRDSQRPHTSRTKVFLKREPQDQTNKTFTWEFISSTARCIVRCKGVGFIRVKIEILRIHPNSGSPPAQHRQWNRNTCECLQKSALFQIPSSSHESNDPERRRPTYGSWPNDLCT